MSPTAGTPIKAVIDYNPVAGAATAPAGVPATTAFLPSNSYNPVSGYSVTPVAAAMWGTPTTDFNYEFKNVGDVYVEKLSVLTAASRAYTHPYVYVLAAGVAGTNGK